MWKRNRASLWRIVTEIDTFLLNTCPGVLHSSCSERQAHLKEKASKISKFSRKLEVATKAGECFQTFKIVRDCNQGRGNYQSGSPTDMCLDVREKWVGEPDSEIPAGGVLLHLQLGALFLTPGNQIGHGDCHGDRVD